MSADGPTGHTHALRTELLLIRHGQTPWNAAGRWQGHGDPALSPLGRSQAESLAAALARQEGFAAIVASDLRRARQTAELLARPLAVPIELDGRLRELDVGRWTGLTRSEIEARDGDALLAFESGDPDVRPGGGESRNEIRRRARAAVHDLRARFAGQRLVVVTHLGVIRALLPGAEPKHADCFAVVAEELARRAPEYAGRRPATGPL